MSQDYIPLATVTLGSAASSVTFSSIPATYRDLVLVVNAKNTVGANYNSLARLNGDTGNNNPSVFMMGNSSGVFSLTRNVDGAGQIGYTNSSGTGAIIAHFMDYSATDKHKTILSRSNTDPDRVSAHAIRWTNTAAITSIAVLSEGGATWASGGRFDLYGILA
jgi:hypothetical protein